MYSGSIDFVSLSWDLFPWLIKWYHNLPWNGIVHIHYRTSNCPARFWAALFTSIKALLFCTFVFFAHLFPCVSFYIFLFAAFFCLFADFLNARGRSCSSQYKVWTELYKRLLHGQYICRGGKRILLLCLKTSSLFRPWKLQKMFRIFFVIKAPIDNCMRRWQR